GMGKELYDKFPIVRDVFDEAGSVLGYDIAGKCFKKPHLASSLIHRADLDRTIYTQPAVMVTSYACYRIFEKMCADVDIPLTTCVLAGHSLGEYTALAVSGAMDFRTCLDLVHKRVTYITEFSSSYPNAGLMAIVNRGSELDYPMIVNLAREAQVYITLVNTKNQIVVGGFKKNLEELAKTLKKEGLLTTALKVEGPFHTPLMKPAADRFKEDLDRASVYIASRPIIANVSVDAIVDPGHIRKELYEQIYTCVDWRRSVDKMISNGAEIFIEVGPKKVLSNMIKDIDPSIRRFNVEDVESLETTVKELAAHLGN
ncbi:MAG: ACP S-malonyltransferase, partial [Proteobacteria bacterium]|nr:ACP S-malonyltransferase [Pseudomonadota bacterium]